jgi:hypothetical protein
MDTAARGDADGRENTLVSGNVREFVASSALDTLRWDWGDAYEIEVGDEHDWRARRSDGRGGAIEGAILDELRKLIVEDYTLLPVPRDLP